ncbi:MAG: hypothetical protein ACLS3C_14815 [Oscillospiraceae bacterium]
MAEETQQENAVRSGDDVTCPNCGSHNVRCIPYPKAEFGIWFVLWLIVAFGGYMISVFITIVGIIFWSIALVIRLKQNKLARQYVRMQCTTCGTEFDVARSELMKGATVNEQGLSCEHFWSNRRRKHTCGRKSPNQSV